MEYKHVSQGGHKKSKWKKNLVIIFWILQSNDREKKDVIKRKLVNFRIFAWITDDYMNIWKDALADSMGQCGVLPWTLYKLNG